MASGCKHLVKATKKISEAAWTDVYTSLWSAVSFARGINAPLPDTNALPIYLDAVFVVSQGAARKRLSHRSDVLWVTSMPIHSSGCTQLRKKNIRVGEQLEFKHNARHRPKLAG